MQWTEAELNRHISDGIEEHSGLDYKASGSLGKQNDKTTEITKDVSAFANSAGGTIIYGIKEFARPNNHLPETLDPIDRTQFSKEWLETIINTIRPRISVVVVTPVSLSSGPNHVCYVVEVPQGHTAHQARDLKFYRRYNFQSVPMEHHEILDVMNRGAIANASVDFSARAHASIGAEKHYLLLPKIKNEGTLIINNLKLLVDFPRKAGNPTIIHVGSTNLLVRSTQDYHHLQYYSTQVLFPEDELSLGDLLPWVYSVNDANRLELMRGEERGEPLKLSWTLFADNMPRKQGTFEMKKLFSA